MNLQIMYYPNLILAKPPSTPLSAMLSSKPLPFISDIISQCTQDELPAEYSPLWSVICLRNRSINKNLRLLVHDLNQLISLGGIVNHIYYPQTYRFWETYLNVYQTFPGKLINITCP